MMKRPLSAAAVAMTCMVALGTTAAHADLLDDVMKAKKIRIATDMAIPPSGMMDANLKPTGSDVETAQLLRKTWGWSSNSCRPRRDSYPQYPDQQGGHHHLDPFRHAGACQGDRLHQGLCGVAVRRRLPEGR